MKLQAIEIECQACNGTGLYVGFAEPLGTAVICYGCDGTGKVTFTYRPFIKRKGKRGVETVARSAGTLIATGVGPVGKTITYAEFKQGLMPID